MEVHPTENSGPWQATMLAEVGEFKVTGKLTCPGQADVKLIGPITVKCPGPNPAQ